ncbi:hypothetical protein PHLGIDRAFT_127762 [Phlebiopsis gigantea 11061_1 CR5-6]|uniref:Uncharacterized protein n=1 Tax=Phlebiopsis gigantea (strain 11061_1 CR5-6) TaxID=745531 RepID=A0A0C3SAQ0_PHLG1|nr:hypothetical protein PHLGIDRAFT_127762 [Phlebiopsis gigantea 11061_1 CR5-6]
MVDLYTPGLALYSIPVVWATAFVPNFIKFLKMSNSIGYKNAMPRSNMASLKESQKVTQEYKDHLAKLNGAHENGMENLSLWIGAVLAGYYAGLPHETLNKFAVGYVGLRILYNIVYVKQRTEAQANIRSAVFFTALGLPLTLLIKSGNKLALA